MLSDKKYIGDGVYVAYNGEIEAVILTAENGIRATDKITLNYEVWLRLEAYVAGLTAQGAETDKSGG